MSGTTPRPGEVSPAHNGVLFLDELPEFPRNVLEVMRQPLEDGTVCIARAAMSLTFPAPLMLATAMNPCPCGFHDDRTREMSLPAAHDPALHFEDLGPAHGPDRYPCRCAGGELQGNALGQRARKFGADSGTRDPRTPNRVAAFCWKLSEDVQQCPDGFRT